MTERKPLRGTVAIALSVPFCVYVSAMGTASAGAIPDRPIEEPIARETFDPHPSWPWRGGHEIVFDGSVSGNVLRLVGSPSGPSRATGGPLALPGAGSYSLRWRCRTADVRRPVTLRLKIGERGISDFEHVNQAGTTDWIDHEVSFAALDGETELSLIFHLPVGEVGELRLDDLELRSDPTAFDPGAMPRSARPLAAEFPGSAWVAPLVKIPPSAEHGQPARPADRITLHAAKGEVEEAQLVLRPTSDQARVELELSELTGPSDIPRTALSWRVVESVEIPALAVRSPFGWEGPVPDPLLLAAPFQLRGGCTTSILLQIAVPVDASAGTYRGQVRLISLGGALLQVPLELTVWDFVLPETPSLYSSSHFTGAREPSERDAIVTNILTHRQDPGRAVVDALEAVEWLGLAGDAVMIDFATFDTVVEEVLAEGVKEFALPPLNLRRRTPQGSRMAPWLGLQPLTPEFNAAFSNYLAQIEAHLAQRGWLNRAHLYLWDEPTADEVESFRALLALAKGAAPGLRTAVGGANLPNPELYGLIDIWVPNLRSQILQDDDWSRIAQRQAEGEEVGAYGNNRYALDLPLVFVRLWPWTLRRYGLTRTGWFRVYQTGIDPWDPTFGRRIGSGYFLYPARETGAPPLDSLRWESLRAGMDDHDYFRILTERTEQVRRSLSGEEVFSGERLTQHFLAPMVWGTTERDFAPDEALLGMIRDAMGQEIESAPLSPALLVALVPDAPSRGTLYVRTVAGAKIYAEGGLLPLQDGYYSATVWQRPGRRALEITARLGSDEKSVLRFWPTARPPMPIYLPRCTNTRLGR